MSNDTKPHPFHDGYLFSLGTDGTPICPMCGHCHNRDNPPTVMYCAPKVLQVSCVCCGFSTTVPTLSAWMEGAR